MSYNFDKRQSGFTLVEILTAIGVFGILFAAISIIVHNVLQTIGSSRVRTTALSIAQKKWKLSEIYRILQLEL